jgi:hypothetical protein
VGAREGLGEGVFALSAAIILARLETVHAPLSASLLSVMAWPLLFRVISTAMSFSALRCPCARHHAVERVGKVQLAADHLVAHAGQLASLLDDGHAMLLSKPMTDAMTTDAQSVSGMKPILTSFFSGASEPWRRPPRARAG